MNASNLSNTSDAEGSGNILGEITLKTSARILCVHVLTFALLLTPRTGNSSVGVIFILSCILHVLYAYRTSLILPLFPRCNAGHRDSTRGTQTPGTCSVERVCLRWIAQWESSGRSQAKTRWDRAIYLRRGSRWVADEMRDCA